MWPNYMVVRLSDISSKTNLKISVFKIFFQEDMYLYYDQAITAIENRTAEEKDYVFSTFEDLYDNQIKIIENVDTTKSNELEADLVSNHHIFIGNCIFHS